MNKLILNLLSVGFVGLASLSAAAQPAPVQIARGKQMQRAAQPVYSGISTLPAPMRTNDATVRANFSCKDLSSEAVTWSENFDNGFGGWVIDDVADIAWSLANHASNPFTTIDESNVQSLFVDGPYQVFKRSKSSATSPLIDVPAHGTLKGYVGFSQNFDDECRLYLYASTDDFATCDELWNSGNETGEKPWRWHLIEVSLNKYAGQQVKLRFTYGSGKDDTFDTGGYMGSFYIDGLQIAGIIPIESVSATTGEPISFIDLSAGTPTSYSWSFPGGTPSASSEANPTVYYTREGEYDVTLTVADAQTQDTKTIPAFVKVTGTAPTAAIIPPATFRYTATRLPMVAPLATVRYRDGSAGYPTEWTWTFTGVDEEPAGIYTSTEEAPEVNYNFQHKQSVSLDVANSYGTSNATAEVSVEYYGTITNFEPNDVATTFSLEDKGVFPGTNKMNITAYAEKFSKPSRPILMDGVYVYFTKAEAASVVDQIANVGVHLYTSKDGKPDKRLESCWWSVFELDLPTAGSNTLVGTAFPFTEPQVVNDEFFIVVDGIPEKNDSVNVSFAMAGFRDHGNTAYMLKDDEWIDVSTYFPAGANHTSYLIQPSITHSVICSLPTDRGDLEVGKNAGTADYPLFSIMGYQTPVVSDAEWCKVVNIPNGLTVDTLKIEYSALPAGIDERTANITVTDSVSAISFRVIQKSSLSGIDAAVTDAVRLYPSVFSGQFVIDLPEGCEKVEVFNNAGCLIYSRPTDNSDENISIDGSAWENGVYYTRTYSTSNGYTVLKAIKK